MPELLYYSKKSVDTPWLCSEDQIPLIVKTWTQIKDELVAKMKERNKEVELNMLKGIELYFSLLFWSNKIPVQLFNWEKHVELLECRAVNVEERLSFILAKRNSYPAFIQLSELFIEQQKHFAKKIAIEKHKQK
ncbi:MAG: YpoC family protein [Heyndrickxia sp.]